MKNLIRKSFTQSLLALAVWGLDCPMVALAHGTQRAQKVSCGEGAASF
jgi:hypothetical protein